MPEISDRKLERYERAEKVARELRHQLSCGSDWDQITLVSYLLQWMELAGPESFERPKKRKGA